MSRTSFALTQLKKEVVWQLTALLIVSGFLVYATAASDKQIDKLMPESFINRSVTNVKPSGMSAMLELAKLVWGKSAPEKRAVRTWEFSYRELRGARRPGPQNAALPGEEHIEVDEPPAEDAVHGVLIIASPEQSLSDYDVEDLLAWVKQGNYLVFLDNFPFPTSRRLLNKLDMEVRDLEPNVENKVSDPVHTGGLYSHLRTLRLSAGQSLRGGTPIATIDGITIIAEKAAGKGKVLISSCSSLVDNRHISNSESWSNFQFLANWLSTTDGEILFDERCHGASQGESVFFYFLKGPAGLFAAQLLLILLIGILSCQQRFGRLLSIKELRRISNLEHINGLANTYERANARQAVLEIIWQNLRQKLCRLMQISPHESSEKLIEELRLKGDGPGDIIACLQECEAAIQDKHLSEEKLRELVSACDKISQSAENYLIASSTTSRNTRD
jgi:hypothetical protein